MWFFKLGAHTAKCVQHCCVSQKQNTMAYVVDNHYTVPDPCHEFSGALPDPRVCSIALPGRWSFNFGSLVLGSVLWLLKGILAIISDL